MLTTSKSSSRRSFLHKTLWIACVGFVLLGLQTALMAQQGTLIANATFPANPSSLLVQGAAAPLGASIATVRFAITPNLPNATANNYVGKATLTLYVGALTSPGAFNVYRVTSDWNEGDATAPTYDELNPVVSGVSVNATDSFVTIDVTDLVKQWLGTDGAGTSGVPNYGIVLIANDANSSFAFDRKGGTLNAHTANLAIVLNHAVTSETVTNGVYTIGDQTIDGVKTFTSPIVGSLSGNATTASTAASAGVAQGLTSAADDADIVTPVGGQIYYNTTSNVLRRFDGSTWTTIDAANAQSLSLGGTIDASQINGVLSNATIAGTAVTGNITADKISGNLINATIPGYVAQAGDTMSGKLNLPENGLQAGTSQFVLSNGNVGIGTATPNNRLQVAGLIKFDSEFQSTYIGELAGTEASPIPGPNGSVGNTAVGSNALRYLTTGGDNTAVGTNALRGLTTGTYNTSLGVDSSVNMTTALANTAIGKDALFLTTTGSGNTAVGAFTLTSNNTGFSNTAVGLDAMNANTTGAYNVAIGMNALKNNGDGSQSVAIGALALQNATGGNNVAIGISAGTAITEGSRNVLIGTNAGLGMTTGVHNVIIGFDCDLPTAADSNRLNIGNIIFGTGVDGAGANVSTGNIGIGVNTPTSKLTVAGTVESTTGGFKFPDGTTQTTALGGTVTGITAGTGLSGGGAGGNVTLNVNQSVVAFQTDLASETSARQTSETTLQNNLSAEVTNRSTAVANLQTSVDSKLAKNGDTMTGTLNLPSDGLVAGSNQLVLSGGNVGIGTSNPATKLVVQGSDPALRIQTTGGNLTSEVQFFYNAANYGAMGMDHNAASLQVNNYYPGDTTFGQIDFRTNAAGTQTSRLYIRGNGNVGVGTTTPTSKFTVAGTVESTTGGFKFPDGTTQTTASVGSTVTGITAGTGLSGGGASGNVTLNVNPSVVAFQTDLASETNSRQAADAALQNNKVTKTGDTMTGTLTLPGNGLAVGNTQLVVSQGSVGVGTAVPRSLLEVKGNGSSTAGRVRLANSGMAEGFEIGMYGASASSNVEIWNFENTDIIFAANNAEVARVKNDGNVGIGTSTPRDRLHVNGIIRLDTLGTAGATQLCRNALNQISDCSSSLRYKTDIGKYTGGLDIINRLQPITFRWRNGGAEDFGLGAEDVKQAEPLLAIQNSKGEVEGVKYDHLSVVLINALKQQQEQISRQQDEIETLKKLVCADHKQADVCKKQ